VSERTRLTTVDEVHEKASWLFTVRDRYGDREEVVLVPCDEGVEAWVNRCMHQPQRLDRGYGAAVRDGEIVCPRHGSAFDTCSGDCDNGEAAGTTLVDVDVDVEDGAVYLADDEYTFAHAGKIGDEDGDEDGGPNSTSHISF
jgi:nitrite reductase/ring-hydroxylating ferredoxin subunit